MLRKRCTVPDWATVHLGRGGGSHALSDIAQEIPFFARRTGSRSNRPVSQLGHEQPVVQSPQAFEHSTVPAASRTGHRASQKTDLFGSNSKVKGMATSRVFAGGSVDDPRALKILIESLHCSASLSEEHLKAQVGSPCPC
jgi:hypothetical protein